MENEFKGTKGQWCVCDEDITFSHVAHDTYHQIKAGCGYHDARENKGFCISGFMSISDAKLIAAAPELLDACQWLLMALRDGTSMDVEIGKEKAESAIEKALGK